MYRFEGIKLKHKTENVHIIIAHLISTHNQIDCQSKMETKDKNWLKGLRYDWWI